MFPAANNLPTDKTGRLEQGIRARAMFDCIFAEVTAPRTRTGHALKQVQDMASDVV